MNATEPSVGAPANVIDVDFRTPVETDFSNARDPKGEIAQRLVEEATSSAAKLTNRTDKKTGPLELISNSRSSLFNLNPYLINVRAGWNKRRMTDPTNLAHIDSLARSIASIGVQEPLTVFQDGDEFVLTNGHCRLLATFRAIEVYNAEVKSVPVRMESRHATKADMLLSQIVRNSGKGYSPLEQAEVFVELLALGWNEQQIADKAGIGVARVNQLIDFHANTKDSGIVEMIESGVVSTTTAEKVIRENDGDVEAAEQVLKEAAEVAADAGKKKVTQKHLDALDGDKAAAKAAAKAEKLAAKAAAKAAAKVAASAAKAELKAGKKNFKAEIRAIFDCKTTSFDTSGDNAVVTMSYEDYEKLVQLLKL